MRPASEPIITIFTDCTALELLNAIQGFKTTEDIRRQSPVPHVQEASVGRPREEALCKGGGPVGVFQSS